LRGSFAPQNILLRERTAMAGSNTSQISAINRWLVQKLYESTGAPNVRLVVGESANLPPHATNVAATVRIDGWRTLAALALNPEIGFGDGYSEGRIEVEGDLVKFLEEVLEAMPETSARGWHSRLFSRWLDWLQANTLRGSARNIHHHYDLSADFYKLWLDSKLVYTCAYFPEADATLEQAQIAKMDHVCRKIRLQPGERVVEAGCGWGALALHMARYYGARVTAFNISREQVLVARDRAKREGLEELVEFVEDDYRNISGHYDAFVSVGMLEHIGRHNYETLGRVIHRTIGDDGRGILHFIGRNQPHAFSPWIRKRIFPGAYVPSLAQSLGVLEPGNFSVLDVENLRMHYAKTLEFWLDQFEGEWDSVVKMFGTEFAQAWRLYLAGSIAAFRVGNLQLFQIVFAGAKCRQIPWTRAHLYADERADEKDLWIRAIS
jgi:cyclopropane-fatty-acyl-phospholipid synthase